MNGILGALFPVILIVLGYGVIFGFFWLGVKRFGGIRRKSPFTRQFLRSPGYSIELQIDDVRTDLISYLVMGMMFPSLVIAIALSQSFATGKAVTHGNIIFFSIFTLFALLWLGYKSYSKVTLLRKLRLGCEGEVGVGQELNQLMHLGFRVYHDFPADKFNIDHIVIGQTGVFAVETKARAKPDTGDGRKDARCQFDGKKLIFPGWVETAPIEQAERQSQWLCNWLSSAVGETVPVVSVLAVPGWFIEQTNRARVLIYNGRKPETVFPRYRNGTTLDNKMIQRIAHQVEAKCRDVVPRAYSELSTSK